MSWSGVHGEGWVLRGGLELSSVYLAATAICALADVNAMTFGDVNYLKGYVCIHWNQLYREEGGSMLLRNISFPAARC
jgi:hypothetical protein